MKLDIKLTDSVEVYNCFDGLVVSTAEWKKRDYRLAHAEAWDFSVKYEIRENPPVIFSHLVNPRTLAFDLLESCSGISLSPTKFDSNVENFLVMLKKELSQQRPIIISLDYYWCPWNKDVGIPFHNPHHTTLVIGFDELGLICLDYSPRCNNCVLPYEYINRIDEYLTMNFEEPNLNYCSSIITRGIQLINDHDIFNKMRKFGEHIQESFSTAIGLECVENSAYIPKIWNLKLIAESRCLYANTLRIIGKKNNIEPLLIIAEELESTKPMWLVIRSLFAKIYVSKDLNLIKRIAEKIYEIADYEESIYKSYVMVMKNFVVS
jgi:hypothetical protein